MGLGGSRDPSSFQASQRDPRYGKVGPPLSAPPHLWGRTWRLPLAREADGWGLRPPWGVRVGRSVPSCSPCKHDNHQRLGAWKPGRGLEAGGGTGRVASRPRPRPAPSFLRGALAESSSPEGTGVHISRLGGPASECQVSVSRSRGWGLGGGSGEGVLPGRREEPGQSRLVGETELGVGLWGCPWLPKLLRCLLVRVTSY